MSRDKLITIRIEESKRNAFRKWAKNNKVDGATFLYRVIVKDYSLDIYCIAYLMSSQNYMSTFWILIEYI